MIPLLEKIGSKHGTDKVLHGFLPIYENYLKDKRHDFLNLCEIGVFFGASIKMWGEYLPNSTIYGLDAFEGKQGNGSTFTNYRLFFDEVNNNQEKYPRIKLYKVDQSKKIELEDFVKKCQNENIKFDVIIDDGSHLMFDQQITLYTLLPLVRSGGIYIMEDLHTSFQKGYDIYPDGKNTTDSVLEKLNSNKTFDSVYLPKTDWSNYVKNIDFYRIRKNSQTAIINVL